MKTIFGAMDGIQLRDEAVRDRIRFAEEFLDPSMLFSDLTSSGLLTKVLQAMLELEGNNSNIVPNNIY